MGMPLFKCNCKSLASNSSNPDPKNWKLIKHVEIGSCLVVELQYPNCTNYEGRKILVFRCSLVDLINQKEIDPHFSENKDKIYPIARFEPTGVGWVDACGFARTKPK